jgi:hypothetical protein
VCQWLVKNVSMIDLYSTVFGSSLPPVVCGSAHVLFKLFVFAYVLKETPYTIWDSSIVVTNTTNVPKYQLFIIWKTEITCFSPITQLLQRMPAEKRMVNYGKSPFSSFDSYRNAYQNWQNVFSGMKRFKQAKEN